MPDFWGSAQQGANVAGGMIDRFKQSQQAEAQKQAIRAAAIDLMKQSGQVQPAGPQNAPPVPPGGGAPPPPMVNPGAMGGSPAPPIQSGPGGLGGGAPQPPMAPQPGMPPAAPPAPGGAPPPAQGAPAAPPGGDSPTGRQDPQAGKSLIEQNKAVLSNLVQSIHRSNPNLKPEQLFAAAQVQLEGMKGLDASNKLYIGSMIQEARISQQGQDAAMRANSMEEVARIRAETAQQIADDKNATLERIQKMKGETQIDVAKLNGDSRERVASMSAGERLQAAGIMAGAHIDAAKIGAGARMAVAQFGGDEKEWTAQLNADAREYAAQAGNAPVGKAPALPKDRPKPPRMVSPAGGGVDTTPRRAPEDPNDTRPPPAVVKLLGSPQGKPEGTVAKADGKPVAVIRNGQWMNP